MATKKKVSVKAAAPQSNTLSLANVAPALQLAQEIEINEHQGEDEDPENPFPNPDPNPFKLQNWVFTIADFHRTTPEETMRTFLTAIEIPVFKHLQRLTYAAKWGLDPGYVVVS